MTVLFYNSGECKYNYTPENLTEDIWAAYVRLSEYAFKLKFKCIVDYGFPHKMSIRIIEPSKNPYCTIVIDHKEYETLKYLCDPYVTFEKEGLDLEE